MLRRSRNAGFSLVELMVAIVIGLILVAGVIQLFVNNQQVSRVHEAQSRLQESGRYAMSILMENIEKAGYLGCATRSNVTVFNALNTPNDFLWNLSQPIQGNEATGGNWTPALDNMPTAEPGNDVITVRVIEPPEIRVETHTPSTPPGSSEIVVNGGTGLEANDIMLAHDCVAAAIFEITSTTAEAEAGLLEHEVSVGGANTPGNSTDGLGYNFGEGWVNKIATKSFYIRNNPDNNPSLYQKRFDANAVELIEGIEQMQITYGEDTSANGSANEYRTANNVGNWGNVVSVRISLVAVSLEDNLTVDGPQLYAFNGVADIDPGDTRLRRVFTRTITLRNRVP